MEEEEVEADAEEGRPSRLQVLARTLRALRGWTRDRFAAKAKVTPKTVYRCEAGEAVPLAKTLEKMAGAVDLSLGFIDVCLAPALDAARSASAPFDGETYRDLEAAGAELEKALTGAGRSAIALVMEEIREEDREPWERAAPPSEADRLEAAAAWERLAARDAKVLRFLVEACPELQTWAFAERLCHASEDAASGSAEDALELAQAACRAADLARCEEPFGSRLRGYTRGYLANARRVKTDLREAREGFAHALKLWGEGAGAQPDLLAEWRLLDRAASLSRADRRFAHALDLLARAQAAAPREAHGRILLNRAFTLQQQGDAKGALSTLREAEPLVDGQREPHRLYSLRMNLAVTLCDRGRYKEAESLLPQVRELAVALRKELDQVRVLWLTGKVAAGLGRKDEARLAFEQVRRAFTERQMAYDCALVSLDLAALHLEEGHTAEVRALAAEMLWIFKAQGIEREALSALKLFCDAARQETATAEQARRLGDCLQRALREPGLRFEG
jgi:transcriptional regulator with XRE-family HTH domain